MLLGCCLFGWSCTSVKSGTADPGWKTFLQERLPLLGHRNWIVVTDMAYPLQTKPGVEMVFAPESYAEVLSFVRRSIEEADHVYPHVYQDQELAYLQEDQCAGIEAFRTSVDGVLVADSVMALPHERLLGKLDSISTLYRVLVVKTSLTMPYTSTFFELDCRYWDAGQQKKLSGRMVE